MTLLCRTFGKLSCAVGLFTVLIFASVHDSSAQVPTLGAQPTNQLVAVGLTANFSVSASGSSPLRYQWRFNDSPIDGATNSTYSITNVQPEQAGSYSVVVTNTLGQKTSTNATLAVGNLAVWGNNLPVSLDLTNVVSVAAGQSHFLAVKNDGTVVAWGNNSQGQATVPAGLSNVVSVAAAGSHSLALRSNGTVVAWGSNGYGESGIPASLSNVVSISAGPTVSLLIQADGTPVIRGTISFAQPLPLGTKVRALAAGDDFYLTLTEDGRLLASGGNSYGQITIPPGLSNVVAISANANFSLALRSDGTVVGWGGNDSGQTSIPSSATNVVAISAGGPGGYALAIRQDGSAIFWGSNPFGRRTIPSGLTNVIAVVAGNNPLAIRNLGAPCFTVQPPDRKTWTGQAVTLSGLTSGIQPTTYQWLLNGEVIEGATNTSLTLNNPQSMNSGSYTLVASNAMGVVTSRAATLTVRQQVSMATWGNNGSGQCTVPPGLSNIVAIAGGSGHSLALQDNGKVIGWGSNGGYEAVRPPDLTNTIAIAAGDSFNVALKADGKVRLWGFAVSSSFTNNSFFNLSTYTAVAAGPDYVLLLRDGGTVEARFNGAAFIGFPPNDLSGVTGVAAGYRHALALKSDGTVVPWGQNYIGQTNVPAGLSNVVAIACGYEHSLALQSNGTVVAWGNSGFGQTNVPPGLTNVVAITAGGYQSMALKSDGTTVAWGWNTYGQSSSPEGLTNVFAISSGFTHSLALVGDGAACIGLQPLGLTTVPGAPADFTASASGSAPVSFQWRFNGADILNATNNSLTISNLQPVDVGDYSVVVANSLGSMTSAPAPVTLGRIIAWGANGMGQGRVPPGITDPIAISGGWIHGLALSADGAITNWGLAWVQPPADVTNVTKISAGPYADAAVLNDGSVVAWGPGYQGETNVPPGLSNIVAVAASDYHMVALKKDGRVIAWGSPQFDTSPTNVPPDLTNAVAIAGGDSHSLALKDNGRVIAWGQNYSGQTNVPTGLSNVVAIAASFVHNLALKADGTVVPWGDSSYGLNTPPAGLTNVIAIACAPLNNIAIKSDGTCVVWGNTQYGQTTIPPGVYDVVAVAGSFGSVTALLGDGKPYITVHPFNRNVFAAGTVMFNLFAAGNGPLSYQWQFNGTNLAGANGSSLTLTNVALTQAGSYMCIVSNALGTATSSPAALTVLLPPIGFDTSASGLQVTNGLLRMRFTGFSESGPVILYASTNLVNWEPVLTNPPALGTCEFFDGLTNFPGRFYRAAEVR